MSWGKKISRHWRLAVCCGLLICGCVLVIFLLACGNVPWPREYARSNTLFVVAAGEYKTLDPALSYYEHELNVIGQITEGYFDFDYKKRPYTLIPCLLKSLPQPIYLDKDGRPLPEDAPDSMICSVEYHGELRPGVRYQPHPAFAVDKYGYPRYLTEEIPNISNPLQWKYLGSREVTAEDLKVALVRQCDPNVASPVYSTLKSFIAGMEACSEYLRQSGEKDYRKVPLSGFEQTGRYTFTLRLTRRYPQALYWMTMPFFAPMPYEVLELYRRPQVAALGINMGRWPVGTGPYMLSVNETDSRFILKRNPNYWGKDSNGHQQPYIDSLYFAFENETLPAWLKFRQGFFDLHSVPQGNLESVMSVGDTGGLELSEEMRNQGVSLHTSVRQVTYYYSFNMLDPVFGGSSESCKKIRQAISIVIDSSEYIALFMNGRGQVAQGILPPGIAGSEYNQHYFNTFVFNWDQAKNAPVRKTVEEAQALMKEAGFPNGIGADGTRLQLHYDHAAAGQPGFVAQFRWLKSRLELIGIDLVDRGTDLNRMRDKLKTGSWQLTRKGWVADYPDPENFLFLYYSKNAHAINHGKGANYANYCSDEYDRIFKRLETMSDSPERLKLIQRAMRILWEDAPVVWEYFPTSFNLTQPWLHNYYPCDIGLGYMKYYQLDWKQRQLRNRRIHIKNAF